MFANSTSSTTIVLAKVVQHAVRGGRERGAKAGVMAHRRHQDPGLQAGGHVRVVARLFEDLAGKRGLEHGGGPLVRSHTLNKVTVRGKNRVNFPPVTGPSLPTLS
jgi:hypothetical protein